MVNSGGNLVLKDGGTISGNRGSAAASYSSYGGGVYVDGSGMFAKQSGGIIYGSNATSALKNIANNGNAVYISASPAKIRNTTVGAGVTLDSAASGSVVGWE
jgi:hypothetical protein